VAGLHTRSFDQQWGPQLGAQSAFDVKVLDCVDSPNGADLHPVIRLHTASGQGEDDGDPAVDGQASVIAIAVRSSVLSR